LVVGHLRGIVSRMSTATPFRDSALARVDAMRLGVVSGSALLGTIGLLLLVRRASGGITAELDVASLAATLALAAVVVFGGRFVWDRLRRGAATRFDQAAAWFGTASLLLLCLGAAWPSSQSSAWLLWLPLVGADWYSRSKFLRPRPLNPTHGLMASQTAPFATDFEGEPFEDGSVLQQVVRVRDAEGVESVRGTLRTDFLAGQRHATLYVGFCPPLARLPDLEAEVVDGADASLKVVQAFAHGARLDLRLSEPAEEACCVIVEFVAAPGDATANEATPAVL
jgi:hypothetical protein